MPQPEGGVQRGEGVQSRRGRRQVPLQRPQRRDRGRHRRGAHALGGRGRLETRGVRMSFRKFQETTVLWLTGVWNVNSEGMCESKRYQGMQIN